MEQARQAVRRMYQETQAELQARGISEVTLHRGIRTEYREPGAVEAWTSDEAIAEQFAGSDGLVLTAIIPAARILAWYDGPGWITGPKGQQFEWIVLSEEPA